MEVKVVNKSKHPLPSYQTKGSAGMDIYANLQEDSITILPGERTLVPTGLFIDLPIGYEAQIRPRSGLAIKKGITCLNSPGTIDSDYRGEIQVILINHGAEAVQLQDGERIAQMVIAKVEQITWEPVDSLTSTERGAGGFGSTGTQQNKT